MSPSCSTSALDGISCLLLSTVKRCGRDFIPGRKLQAYRPPHKGHDSGRHASSCRLLNPIGNKLTIPSPQFLHGAGHVLHRDQSCPFQSGADLHEPVVEPVVIGPSVGHRPLGVDDPAIGQAIGGVQDGPFDACLLQELQPPVGIGGLEDAFSPWERARVRLARSLPTVPMPVAGEGLVERRRLVCEEDFFAVSR
jgi:hypothetical protein